MIQRIQSIWLLLAAGFSAVGFSLSFFSGNKLNETTNIKEWVEYNASQNIPILILTVVIAVAALIAIFMFKDRKRQLLITLVTAVAAFINIALYYNAKSTFAEAKLDLGSLFSFAIPLFLLLAVKSIYKDEKLVKSADRLR
ncbi:MAG: DUF4293 domain-containing protein [Sediminibacterium sp.]|nr:MAG: hypothetical protein FD183_1608 [Chitinophagaceae bacterium]MDP1843222.1 DUF4293 domain-containing protein [Sediminibacterium sp.]